MSEAATKASFRVTMRRAGPVGAAFAHARPIAIVSRSRFSLIAATTWLRNYQGDWLRRDVVAGMTLAAYLLPAGIGDASLAGLPPEAGLYACLFSGLVFWVFCSSRHTVVTVTSALSLLIGASIGAMSGGDLVHHAALAACVPLIVAAIALVSAQETRWASSRKPCSSDSH